MRRLIMLNGAFGAGKGTVAELLSRTVPHSRRTNAWRAATLCGCLVPGCSDYLDAATAIADDVQTGAARLEQSKASTITVVHTPVASRSGCPHGYRVQLTADSALVVWCRATSSTTETISSHTTTYHLNFVDVPETTIVDKDAGQPLTFDLVAGSKKPTLTNVR